MYYILLHTFTDKVAYAYQCTDVLIFDKMCFVNSIRGTFSYHFFVAECSVYLLNDVWHCFLTKVLLG